MIKTKRSSIKKIGISLPLMLTFKSGSALALTSSQLCIQKSQNFANLSQPEEFSNGSNSFLRTNVTTANLVKIRKCNGGMYEFDKDSDGLLQSVVVYVHDQNIVSIPSEWINTTLPPNDQSIFIYQNVFISVYNDCTDLTNFESFELFIDDLGFKYVLADRITGEIGSFKDSVGLVLTDENGNPYIDLLNGYRIGQSIDHDQLTTTNHLTGSCWTSLNGN